jgi:hypothetical protein
VNQTNQILKRIPSTQPVFNGFRFPNHEFIHGILGTKTTNLEPRYPGEMLWAFSSGVIGRGVVCVSY